MVKRQGQSKSQSEIDDIANALDKLAEKKKMPVFVATSSMVLQAPKSKSDILQIQNIEEVVDSAIKRRNETSDKKQDRAISKTEYGNKKIDEILKRLESLEKSARSTNQMAGNQPNNPSVVRPTLWNPHSGDFIPATRNNIWQNTVAENRPSPQQNNPLNNPINQNANMAAQGGPSSQPISVPTYAEISRRNTGGVLSSDNQQSGSWRQRLHILNGAGGGHSTGNSFAADADVVAFNVNKNVSAMDMRSWLSQKGINVKKCELLTTNCDARALSFRISVDPKDYDRVTTDASVWPFQVGIRRYKQFATPRYEQRRSGHQGNDEGSRSFYGNQEDSRHPEHHRYDNQRTEARQQANGGRRYDGNFGRHSGRQY